MERLFVYGPLRDERVLEGVLGYKPRMVASVLPGYRKSTKTIGDRQRPNIEVAEGDKTVKGQYLHVSTEELMSIDHFQADYTRFLVTLGDQQSAWAYQVNDQLEQDPYEPGDGYKGYSPPDYSEKYTKSASAQPRTGPEALAAALSRVDLDQIEKEAYEYLRTGKKTKRAEAQKKLAIIQGLRRTRKKPGDMVLTAAPVVPTAFRPYSVMGDMLLAGDVNELYQDLIGIRSAYNELDRVSGGDLAVSSEFKPQVYDAVKAVFGYGPPVTAKGKERNTKGFLQKVLGSGPKFSFVNRKLLSKPQDFVGRGVIGVDPDLTIDEVGLPEEQAWSIFSLPVQRRLVQSGMPVVQAVQEWADKTDRARKYLEDEMRTRPVLYSRAPVWHKYGTLGGMAKIVEGNQIKISPLIASGAGADYDGDQMNVHALLTEGAVRDAKEKLMPSKMLFNIKDNNRVVPEPKQDILLGLNSAQKAVPESPVPHKFQSMEEAEKALRSGKVSWSDEIEIPDGLVPVPR